jgi:Fic family protein
LPRSLPSAIRLRPATNRLLAETQEALGRLDEAASRLPDRAALVRCTQLWELQATAGLSGVFAMLREAFMVDLPGPAAPVIDERLVRYIRATDAAVAAVKAGRDIDVALLNETSAILMGATPDTDVRWRAEPTWLGGPEPQDAFLIAAPHGPKLVDAAERLSSWLREQNDLLLVGKPCVGHFQWAFLAPFAGADHLARLYIQLQLIQEGVLRDAILPISTWLTRHRREYRDTIRGFVTDGEIDPLVTFMANGIRETCRRQMQLIKELELTSAQQLKRYAGSDVFLRVVSGLIGHPVTNYRQLAERYGISTDYAASLTKRLRKDKLVQTLDNKSKTEKLDSKSYATVVICPAVLRMFGRYQPLPPNSDRAALR